MFIRRVCTVLKKYKLPFAIVGGYAVVLHGVVRGTVDIDIIVRWNLSSLEKVENALSDIGLKSKLPIDAKSVFQFREEYINNRNLIAWNFYNPANPLEQVDIIITYDLVGRKIKTIKTKFGSLPILALDELIQMKEESARPQDLHDVQALKNL